jgi:hypothetical protein
MNVTRLSHSCTSLLKLIYVKTTSSNESLNAFGMAELTMYNLSSSYTIPRHMTELVFNYYYFNAYSTNQICECAMYH